MEPAELLRLAESDPARLMALAAGLTWARPEDASVAERALGVAETHLHDLPTAAAHLRAAIGHARRARSPSLAAEARIRLAFVISLRGQPLRALAEIDKAQSSLYGSAKARADAQRAAVLNHLGRYAEALAVYRSAVPALRRAGDLLWLQRVLSNRAIVHGFRHEFAAAEADLREARRLCHQLGLDLSMAVVRLNLGWVSAVRGDVPAALAHFDAAEERFRALGTHQLAWLLTDRSELLLSVGLVEEARQAAEEAVAELERRQRRIGLPEVRLRLARVAALQDDHERAITEAKLAAVEFARQRRTGWAKLARYVVMSSRVAQGQRSRSLVSALERAGPALAAAGWPAESVEARLLAAALSLDRGDNLLAEAARARLRGPALLRARGWQAEALRRLRRGDRRGAATAVRAGLRILDEHRATFGATDLRAHSARYRVELAELGLRMALEAGGAAAVLGWAEQGRARHLLLPRARPTADPVLELWLAELRVTVGRIEEQRATRSASPEDLSRQQLVLERRIRDHCRTQPPAPLAMPHASSVRPRVLAEALGEHALVEYIVLDGALHAVTIAGGRTARWSLGPADQVRDLIERIPFALRRLASRNPIQGSLAGRNPILGSPEAALTMLRHAAARLDAILLQPLARAVGRRPLVIVPTGALQALPWSILPSCQGRPVTVSPSATLWHAARLTPDAGDGILIAAGPGLPGAEAEAHGVAEIHGVKAVTGREAVAEGVVAAMDGARLAHLAAHGSLHRRNPLFSSLRLADGPLTIYDLERLRRAPAMVVLAACDSGRSVVRAGDELLGLSATFLALGTRTIVASVMSIPDTETAPVMIAMHRLLAAGHTAADSLAQAQRHTPETGLAAAAGFVCMGADSPL